MHDVQRQTLCLTGRKSYNHHFIRITAKVRTPVICFSAPIVYKSVAVRQLQSSLVVSNTLFLILKMQRQLPEIGKITKSLPVAEIARGQFIGFSVIPAKNLFLYSISLLFPSGSPPLTSLIDSEGPPVQKVSSEMSKRSVSIPP